MATGRSPNSKHVGLEEVCISPWIGVLIGTGSRPNSKHTGLAEVCMSP